MRQVVSTMSAYEDRRMGRKSGEYGPLAALKKFSTLVHGPHPYHRRQGGIALPEKDGAA